MSRLQTPTRSEIPAGGSGAFRNPGDSFANLAFTDASLRISLFIIIAILVGFVFFVQKNTRTVSRENAERLEKLGAAEADRIRLQNELSELCKGADRRAAEAE